MNAFAGCGIALQFVRRTPWSGQQFAATVRACALQALIGTVTAEGALERTDQRLSRVGGQITVAAFTVGAQLQHGGSSIVLSGEATIVVGPFKTTMHLYF